MPSKARSALVIGAGIVGLCTAYVLRRSGIAVTVIDPNVPGSQCSSGNAGALSSGSVVPLAMPGLLKSTASMLLDPTGPLHIPPRYWLRGAPWLLRFARSAGRTTVERIADALQPLLHGAVERHARLAEEIGRPDLVRRDGQLHVYPDAASMAKDATGWAMKAARGLRVEHVDAAAIRELEPAVAARYAVGVFLPNEGRVADPQAYCEAIASAARAAGVRFAQGRVLSLSRTQAGWRANGSDGSWDATDAVVCAGAWSAQVLASLGLRVPLQTQRGYHLQLSGARQALSRIVVLADRKVFLNPMDRGLRIAGTVEIDTLERPLNTRRAMLLQGHASMGLQGVTLDGGKVWMGHRPCMPDSMPVLGAVPDAAGLWCGFGHGHLGVTESINTADWLADAIHGRPVSPARQSSLNAFSITRFHGWRH